MNIKDKDKYVLLINRGNKYLKINFQILTQVITDLEILVLAIIF